MCCVGHVISLWMPHVTYDPPEEVVGTLVTEQEQYVPSTWIDLVVSRRGLFLQWAPLPLMCVSPAPPSETGGL